MVSGPATSPFEGDGLAPAAAFAHAEKLRAAYAAENLALCQKSVRTICLLGIVLVLPFVVFDYVRNPAAFEWAIFLRTANVAVFVICLWLIRRPTSRRHARSLALLCATATAAMIYAMMLLTDGHTSHYYSGLGLVLLTVPLVVPWGPIWSSSMCAVVVGGYVAVTLLTEATIQQRFLDNVFALVATSTIAVVTTVLAERLRWQEFQTRWTVAEAYRHKSEFFANMSHELRTPLHVVIGYVDIILDILLSSARSEAREMLEKVRKESMLLYQLVSDMLDYAKVEAGKMEVHLDAVPVAELIADVGTGFRPLVEQKGLQLHTNCPARLAPIVTDRRKIEQVLHNLLGNAIKFTASGHIRIEACAVARLPEPCWADLVFLDNDTGKHPANGAPPGDGVAITVADTGIGIRSADVARLAVDFQQVDGAAAGQYRGTGLGLSLSRKLVGLLGGRIAVRSRLGQGSTFVLFLPERPQAPTVVAA